MVLASKYSLSPIDYIEIPGGSTFKLIDTDGRLGVAKFWQAGAAYVKNELVWVLDPESSMDHLYECVNATSGDSDWSTAQSKFRYCSISDLYEEIINMASGGIHYRGITTTNLYDGATTNPISINGSSYTAASGDLVIADSPSYVINRNYSAGMYFSYSTTEGSLWYVIDSMTSSENTGFDAIRDKVTLASNEPEFLFSGSVWNEFGSVNPLGLGKLAFKDNASGSVSASGNTTIQVPSASQTTSKLVTTTVYGVSSQSTTASLVSAATAKDVAKVGTAVVYGKANVGTATTLVNSLTTTAKSVVSSVATTAITVGSASAVDCSVSGTGLVFASTTTTINQVTSVGTDSVAAVASFTTTSITPATAAPDTQTLTPATSNGQITGIASVDPIPVAQVSSAVTVATGAVATNGAGGTVVTDVQNVNVDKTVSIISVGSVVVS